MFYWDFKTEHHSVAHNFEVKVMDTRFLKCTQEKNLKIIVSHRFLPLLSWCLVESSFTAVRAAQVLHYVSTTLAHSESNICVHYSLQNSSSLGRLMEAIWFRLHCETVYVLVIKVLEREPPPQFQALLRLVTFQDCHINSDNLPVTAKKIPPQHDATITLHNGDTV